MSRKTELRADLHRVGYELSGAHLTRQARCGTFNTFARIMRELGYGIQAASQIGGKHLQAFAQRRTSEGIASRTLANELSHLRAVLKHVDKQGLAANPGYNNRALGIGRGSRLGTKQPLSDEAIRAFQQRMDRLGRPTLGALLELQRSLGLREVEAIRGGNMETLARWERGLQEHGSVRVIAGTKGARPRDVHPAQVDRALAAVRAARALLEASGQRYLVTRADGAVTTGLEQAIGVYKNVCDRAGIQSHGARYAFAQECMQAYRDRGFSEREARAATSLDLGHGDGRGRYVASVYARGADVESCAQSTLLGLRPDSAGSRMGTYAHVWLDGVHLGKIRNDLDGNLLRVFRASDKKVAESLPAVAPEFMQYIADELGDDDDLRFVWYSIPVSALRNRLNVLGYTAEASRKAFEIALEEEKRSNAMYASARRERVQDPPEMVSHAERQAAALDMLDVDVWLHAVRTASQDSEATPFPELSKDITPEAIEYARGRAWFGYPGPDLLVVVSLALEALPDSCELICDVTDFVATDGFDGEEYTSRVGDHTGEYDSAAKIVVLTEGKTDARVLKESLEILHPELIQYYSFLQFEDMRVSGGAGNLANLAKAFAAAGIANRVVAIFDNDTAGHASSQSLEGLALPPHIKVFKLPDLPLLERYPTLGPGGMAELNVNGVAASIELYMGDDVLRGHDGQLMPVQWTGYDRGLGRYQGEVMEKARLHERFNQKLVRARSLSKMEPDDSWSGLETVLHVIFGAFQDLSAQEIADFTCDYYEITR